MTALDSHVEEAVMLEPIKRDSQLLDQHCRAEATPAAPPVTTQQLFESTTMLEAALDYAEAGLAVFPCKPDKTPYTLKGVKDASTDPDKINQWWTNWPNAMIGMAMGKASGVWALDPDAPKSDGPDGRANWRRLVAENGGDGVLTYTNDTPGGGQHLLFEYDDARPVGNSTGNLKGLGIDVRGNGGYIIMPPSVNADGRAYKIAAAHNGLNPAPDWLYDLILSTKAQPADVAPPQPTIRQQGLNNVTQLRPSNRSERNYCETALRRECDALAAVRQGDRNEALNKAAFNLGQLVDPGRLDEREVWAGLERACDSNRLMADGKAAVVATIKSGLYDGMKSPRVINPIERAEVDAVECGKRDIDRLNKVHAVLPIGGKTRVVTFGELPEFPGRETIVMTQTVGDFAALHNKYRHVWEDKDGIIHKTPMGAYWIGSPLRRQFDGGFAFMPQRDEKFVGNRLNLWNGFGVKQIKPAGKSGAAGSRLFLDFMRDVICSGNEEHFDFLLKREATIIQKRIRSEVALGLRTEEEGCGKGFYEKTMGRLFGNHAMQVSNPKHIVGAFNPHLETLLRLTADEALFVGSHEHRNALFGLITESKLTIEPKGCGLYTADSFLNLSITSNAPHFLPVSGTARRFLIPTVSTAHMQDHKYFEAIQTQLDDGGYEALLYHFVHEVDLTGFNVRQVPQTVGLREQRKFSLPPLEVWWCELLETGTLAGADPHSPNRAVSNAYQRRVDIESAYGDTQIRFVNQNGLYDQAKLHEPRLRHHTSDHRLGAHLKEMGCDNRAKVLRRRGWTFPPLLQCRGEWEKRYPGWEWRDPDITEWRAEEADDQANDGAGHDEHTTLFPDARTEQVA